MYLKEIVATGFKSFADKIDIKLDDKITCIVGPNGSGKSNVVDAVRWVLGEQSVKSLRGDGNMSDVIFSGSKSRNPLNVSSVELVFDNTDHYLNFDFSEVSIKRKAYRSGENEYFLNNQRCRLKDIVNLLLDTGIGKESFNIISQGEVDKILSNSSLDRRVIIEEAASVLKYKKRKEEALKKLSKTHDNLDRVNDIIKELEIQVEPLRKQSIKAKEYLSNKKNLESLEVALLAYDIYNDSEKIKMLKEKNETISNKIVDINNDANSKDVSILEDNHKLEKLQNQLANYQNELLSITEEVEKINSDRLLLKEKNKNIKNKSEKEEELRELLEKESKLKSDIYILEQAIDDINSNINNKSGELIRSNREKDLLKQKKGLLNQNFSKIDQDLISINHKIDSVSLEIESMAFIPNGIRKILNEKSLAGIDNIIGNILEVDEEFSKTLAEAIRSSKNFIITDDESASKEAINYLKREKLGRATFFPINIIKPRYVDSNTLNLISRDDDFVCVLSDIVRCDQKYINIVKNQLGIVLVSQNIDSAVRLSEKIGRRYKIITLDGDVINVGGSMTGGESHNNKSSIMLKQEMEILKEQEKNKQLEKENVQKEIDDITKDITLKEDEYFNISKECINLKESLSTKVNNLNTLKSDYDNVNREITSLRQVVDNNIDIYEKELLDKYYDKSNLKEKIVLNIKSLNEEIDGLKRKIDEENATYKLKNSELRNYEREKNELDIEISKLDTKLDSMLIRLNEEYSLTFEKARRDYVLELDSESARSKVNLYKSNIKKIGMVNLDSIEEFERVNTRYEFLCKQKDDLLIAENSLLEIMKEMDGVIEEEFMKTYNLINKEFSMVFKELFGGGSAHLELNNPDDILTTGVDIVASPPGKKLTSISLLSGGEKTLTAISLLFAILNIRSVPFCLFDEVEAALDEANVETFGKYLAHYKNKTQFLIITHKKKTMEYADTLYGITMQESGVSKLVSVKLNEHVDSL